MASDRTVVLVFDESTLGDRPARNSDPGDQSGTYGRAFIKALIDKNIHIIPFVVSYRKRYTKVQPFIDAFFLPMLTLTENNFKYDREETLYTPETVLDMYVEYTGNIEYTGNPEATMPPVYFFDRDAGHVNRMNMFNSYQITEVRPWIDPFKNIISPIQSPPPAPAPLHLGSGSGSGSGDGGSPALVSFEPGKQLGVEPPTPTLGGKRRRLRKTRKIRKSRKGRTKK